MNLMFFIVFSISISLPNELETRTNINRGFLMKNSQCEEPSFDRVDVSQGLNDAYEDKVIYSCQGSFDKTLLTRRSRLLIYSSQFKNIRTTDSGAAIRYFFEIKGIQNINENLLKETIIKDCTFQDCNAREGGAIYAKIDQVYVIFEISDSKFLHNSATKTGGAIHIIGNNITIDRCQFTNNKALEGANDFYFNVYKFWSLELQDAPHGFSIENCNFECILYKNMLSMFYFTGNTYKMNFVGNTVSVIDTNSNPEKFVIFSNDPDSYDQILTFKDNFIFPFNETIVADDAMIQKAGFKFSDSFTKSSLSFKKCQTPPSTFQDISTGFDSIDDDNNIYGCDGSYDKKINILMSYEQCGDPPKNYLDISDGLEEIKEGQNVYGCNGTFDKQVKVSQALLLVYYCSFSTTSEKYDGGAVYISISSTVDDNKGDYIIEGCSFENCSGKSGGSIYIDQKNAYGINKITNSAFMQSKAENNGGAIYLSFFQTNSRCNTTIICDTTIENCTFEKCKGSDGGCFYFYQRYCYMPLNVINNTFKNNSASSRGGAFYFTASRIFVNECHFIDNLASRGSDFFLSYSLNNCFANHIIKLFEITNNDFHQSLDENMNSLVYLESNDVTNLTFVGNTIEIAGKNLLNQNFSAIYFAIILQEAKFADNFISTCNETIAAKVENIQYKFEEWFPNCAIATPSPKFSDSSKFSRSFYFSESGHFTNSDEFRRTESIAISPSLPLENGDYCLYESQEKNYTTGDCNFTIKNQNDVIIRIILTNFTDFIEMYDGGAVYINNAGLDCTSISFTHCISTKGGGGAIYIKNTPDLLHNVTIDDTLIKRCQAQYGGGCYIYSQSEENEVFITRSNFSENVAILKKQTDESKNFFDGSHLFITAKNVKVKFSIFEKGVASGVKVYNVFDQIVGGAKKLDEAPNHIFISGCNFDHEGDSSSINFIDTKSDSKIELVECGFAGKIAENSHYIDGKVASKDADNIKLISCNFEYKNKMAVRIDSLNEDDLLEIKENQKNASLSSLSGLSSLGILVIILSIALIIITLISLVILLLSKRQFELDDTDNE